MKEYEKKIISKLLSMAYDKFSNHGCNDTPQELLDLMTEDEQQELARNMAINNGELEEFEEDGHSLASYDHCLMSYFSAKIVE